MRKLLLGLIGLLFAVPAVATDLPAGYTPLEYIESTGTQYIDTGMQFNANTNIEIDFQYTNLGGAYNDLFGVTFPSRVDKSYLLRTNSNGYAGMVGKSVDIDTERFDRHTYKVENLNMYLDGVLKGTGISMESNPINAYLFASQNENRVFGQSKAKVYYFKIWNGSTLVRNFVPAKNSSNVVGMYDTVSGTFFTNAGTGSFIAGPVVPETPIKIATTAYNSARFSPVVTELNDTIATIRDVVTNTINQTKAIADLQATKQTRPDENCPAGKKCLLVEDNDGQPHWYEIVESAD